MSSKRKRSVDSSGDAPTAKCPSYANATSGGNGVTKFPAYVDTNPKSFCHLAEQYKLLQLGCRPPTAAPAASPRIHRIYNGWTRPTDAASLAPAAHSMLTRPIMTTEQPDGL